MPLAILNEQRYIFLELTANVYHNSMDVTSANPSKNWKHFLKIADGN